MASNHGRRSNYEALRLIAMVSIVLQHYAGNTPWKWDRECETYLWTNEFIMNCMATTGKIGVDIFLMLTGYFLNGRGLKASSLARTWFQTLNWSYMFLIAAYFLIDITSYQYKLALFPIVRHGYWFVASYIVAAFCSGWVATVAKYATPAQFFSGLFSLFTVMCVFRWPLEISYCNILWFIFAMAVGALFRRYISELETISTKKLLSMLALLSLINYGSVYYFTFHNVEWANQRHGPTALMRENWSILCLLYAMTIFLLVHKWEFSSSLVNRLGGCTLGVYLTHENQFLQPRLWANFVKGYMFKDSVFLPLIGLTQVLIVYLICSFAEYLRQLVFGWLEEWVSFRAGNFFDKLADRINNNLQDEKLPV